MTSDVVALIAPSRWGASAWRFIHTVALGRDVAVVDDANDTTTPSAAVYRAYFELLGDVLPCRRCAAGYRRHFSELSSELDAALADKNAFALFDWTVKLHNAVNKDLGPQQRSDWTRDEVLTELVAADPPQQQPQQQPSHALHHLYDVIAHTVVLAGGFLLAILTGIVLWRALSACRHFFISGTK